MPNLPKNSSPAPGQNVGRSLSRKLNTSLAQLKLNKSEAQTASAVAAKEIRSAFMGTFGANPTGSSKELVFECIDFFDYVPNAAAGLRQYAFNPKSFNLTPPFPGAGGSASVEDNVGKIKAVRLYALPDFSTNVAAASVQVLFGCPVNKFGQYNSASTPPDQGGFKATAAQKATLLTPTSVSDWVEVGSWSAASIFKDANFGPTYTASQEQVLFTIACLDPDDASLLDLNVQFMVVVQVEQSLPPLGTAQVSLVESASVDAWTGPVDNTASVNDEPVMVTLKRLQNAI